MSASLDGSGGGWMGSVPGRFGPLMVSVVVAAVLATACSGGRDGPGVAQLRSDASASASPPGAIAFARCMRSHGVTNFPDSGGIQPGMGIDPNASAFRAAMRACRPLLPQGQGGAVSAKDQAAFLAFSACMRSHGVTNFPDPDFSGGGATISVPAGVDPGSPQFQAAQKACQHDLPGGGPHRGPRRVP